MKVKVAAQTLSKSVADALLYLSDDLQLHEFKGCSASAQFVQLFNDLFDIFNSRNRFCKYIYKRPLSAQTKELFFDKLDAAKQYILTLTLGGKTVLNTARKTGFLGFLINIESLKHMYTTYVEDQQLLKYLLTYKLSQDHLELFFGAIRSKGGYNNNPTARQFEAAYKRLLIHCAVSAPQSGNAVNLEHVPILSCNSGSSHLTTNDDGIDLTQTTEYVNFEQRILENLKTYDTADSSAWHLTDYVCDVVSYIAGFIAKTLDKCITCCQCKQLLGVQEESHPSALQSRKQYGKLRVASNLLITVCEAGEKYFRFYMKTTGLGRNVTHLSHFLTLRTLPSLPSTVSDDFGDHLYDDDPIENHTRDLLRLILQKYFDVRIHHECVKRLDHETRERVRSNLTKTILFKNQ